MTVRNPEAAATGTVAANGKARQPARAAAEPGKQWVSVQAALKNAVSLYSAGKLSEAENLIRQIVTARPKLADAHNVLGVVLHRQGKTEEGIKALKQAIALNGSAANYFSNLGEMERQKGYLDAAQITLQRAITLDAGAYQAWNNLGIVYFDKRDFAKAEESYRKAIAAKPDYAEAYNNLGNALRARGKADQAIEQYERAIELKGNYPEAYNNMGTVLRDTMKFEEAEFSYRRAVSLRPEYLDAHNNLATLLVALDRSEEALRALGDILKKSPGHVPALVSTARAQLRRGNVTLAEAAVKRALKLEPKNSDALCVYGQVCHDADRYEEAVKVLEASIASRPDNVEALNLLGIALKSVGQMEKAKEAFVKALELQPLAIGAYSNLVDLEKFTPDHPMFVAMTGLMAKVKNPEDERFMALHFSLGKAYDDVGDPEKSFYHYELGTRLRRQKLDYKEAEVMKFFDQIREVFSEEFFANRPYAGDASPMPVFIIGMPRSGSTLTEQILASHPKVHGAGEIKTLTQSLGLLRQKFPNLPRYPEMGKRMKSTQYGLVADHYLGTLKRIAGDAERVTDKLLTNYYFAGLAHTLFPNAKIIHTMRDPVDTCLSTFTKLFKDDMPHSYNLGELGRYYRKYEELMEHWRKVLPAGTMMDVKYEDVVDDVENHARRIVDFVGLEWDDQCLAFHESNRPVKTASVSQVRKPIYSTSVERWRRYEGHLDPLFEALGYDAEGVRRPPA
ncbi:tetratricopeptide (TPR) repeat protein [Rhodoligotrophos appendicifer]|uniref:tetratricopeptide repeat-containing sulfotransferase family protein n=1 Tax=Rhodoligotrophos appendicifer TaxID=987056 RepID=UPI001186DB67|nr:tetratricopeptide repeat-containing sulfotransferase family protein [Rhodoligotrophos appendicifer]